MSGFGGFFGADSLITGYDDCFVDVFGEAAARKIVDGSGETLKHGAYGLHSAETLHELIGDIADLETREHQNIGAAVEIRLRRLVVGHVGNDGGIGLQFTVENERRIEFVSQFGGADNLVDPLA